MILEISTVQSQIWFIQIKSPVVPKFMTPQSRLLRFHGLVMLEK